MLGLGVERRRGLVENEQERTLAHEPPRQRQLLPLPEAELDPIGPGGTKLRLEPRRQLIDDVGGAAALDRRLDCRPVVQLGHVTDAD